MINNERHNRALKIAEKRIKNSKVMEYVKELYLYGSLARGDVRWGSDIDLLLVLDNKGKEIRELKKEIIYLKGNLTEDDLDAPEVDLKVVFGDEWKKSSQLYYKNVRKEGIKLWSSH